MIRLITDSSDFTRAAIGVTTANHRSHGLSHSQNQNGSNILNLFLHPFKGVFEPSPVPFSKDTYCSLLGAAEGSLSRGAEGSSVPLAREAVNPAQYHVHCSVLLGS